MRIEEALEESRNAKRKREKPAAKARSPGPAGTRRHGRPAFVHGTGPGRNNSHSTSTWWHPPTSACDHRRHRHRQRNVAREIHRNSARAEAPVAVDCGALPDDRPAASCSVM